MTYRAVKIGWCWICMRPVKSTEEHHIDGDHDNNKPDNLIELCIPHHHYITKHPKLNKILIERLPKIVYHIRVARYHARYLQEITDTEELKREREAWEQFIEDLDRMEGEPWENPLLW